MDFIEIYNEIEIWKKLSINDIRQISQVNINASIIYDDEYFWNYILKRDFNIENVGNSKETYIKFNRILEYFSKYYKIITKRALDIINNYIPRNYWEIFIKLHQEYSGHIDMLNFIEICQVIKYIPLNVNQILENLMGYAKSVQINGKDMYMLVEQIEKEEESEKLNILDQYLKFDNMLYINGESMKVVFDYELVLLFYMVAKKEYKHEAQYIYEKYLIGLQVKLDEVINGK